ncbi:hypothetical protein CAAN1_02S02234 [[Candida] anglica]|uniref:Bul1 N-terminal domain-containing protein n=1 Tax=[Candida] anglica TaxID=148631 RepID=A0ABP0E934_9ASCO
MVSSSLEDSHGSRTSTESSAQVELHEPFSSLDPTSNVLPPITSPKYTEYDHLAVQSKTNKVDPQVWNILPSYHMYTSTVSKSLSVSQDDQAFVPPTYDDSATLYSNMSGGRASGIFSISGTVNTSGDDNSPTEAPENPNLIIADESSNQWQNTILDNLHTLNNLSHSDNEYADALKIDVFYTSEVGELGKKPHFIDPSNYEYKQGDLINGYILVENRSDKVIPFDMFYVLFEGNFKITSNILGSNKKDTLVNKKFLEMFDFSASWNYGNINRLVSDYSNPYTSLAVIDPLDDTHLSFGQERVVKPFVKHKRFFTFRIPDKLLDSSCGNNLSSHTQIPPSIGLSPEEQWARLQNPNFKRSTANANDGKFKDFSFMDTCISYSVSARFIGKSSMYGVLPIQKPIETTLVNTTGDEFLILKDNQQGIRIIQETSHLTPSELVAKEKGHQVLFDNLLSRIDDQIACVTEILNTRESKKEESFLSSMVSPTRSSTANTPLASTIAKEIAKCRQMYKPKSLRSKSKASYGSGESEEQEYIKVFHPIEKKSITGMTKLLGTIALSTPKTHYKIGYIPPPQFRTEELETGIWNLEIPIDMQFVPASVVHSAGKHVIPPEATSIKADMVAFTIRSNGGSIPIEFNHDMLFQNNSQYVNKSKIQYEADCFDNNIMQPMKTRAEKLKKLSLALGSDVFRMDANLAEDLKNMCKLHTKYIKFNIDGVKVKFDQHGPGITTSLKQVPWEANKGSEGDPSPSFTKKFTVSLDLSTIRMMSEKKVSNSKAYDNFNLVPDFQMCQMSRFYYLKLTIAFQKGEEIIVSVPLEVQKLQ